jgi:hypothetical protein
MTPTQHSQCTLGVWQAEGRRQADTQYRSISVQQRPRAQLLPLGECTQTWDSPEVRLHSPMDRNRLTKMSTSLNAYKTVCRVTPNMQRQFNRLHGDNPRARAPTAVKDLHDLWCNSAQDNLCADWSHLSAFVDAGV